MAGYVGGALGLVLGTLRLPLIVLATGSPATAAGTNIGISAAAAAGGGWTHARAGRVDWRIVAWMAPPSIVGAVVGALYGDDVSRRLLYAGIAAVLVWSGVDLVWRPLREGPAGRTRVWPAVVFGFVIGLLGGAVGVILGTLRMPALLRGVGMSAARAVGTNLVVGFLLGIAALVAQATELDVEWDLLAVGIAGALPGAWLGARLTGVLSETFLRRAVGTALVLVGAVFAVQAVA